MPTPGALPASVGKRLLAFIIDTVAGAVLGGAFVVAGVAQLLGATGAPPTSSTAALLGVGGVVLLAFVVAQWWSQGRRGRTLGAGLVGLRTLSADTGRPAGLARILVRSLVVLAGALAAGVGLLVVYASPLLDRSGYRRGWHDRAAGVTVYDVAVGVDPATAASADTATATRRLTALLAEADAAPGGLVTADAVPVAPAPAAPPVDEPQEIISVVPAAAVAAAQGGELGSVTTRARWTTTVVTARDPEALDDDLETTRLSAVTKARAAVPTAPVTPHATLLLWDGRQVRLEGTALVGRDPCPRDGEAAPDRLIPVDDTGRSVSKTHLVIGVDPTGVWIRDRSSTNGTVVTLADGQQVLCAAEQTVRVPSGASVAFGDYWVTVV